MKKNTPRDPGKDDRKGNDPEGYPLYPPSDDIYNRFHEEQEIDPEDPTRLKEPVPPGEEDVISPDDINLFDDELGEVSPLDEDILRTDLDIPGSELDDDLEDIGAEDEENNYYSIGGDNHHDLEEDDGILDEEL